jgi:hypothetical protein
MTALRERCIGVRRAAIGRMGDGMTDIAAISVYVRRAAGPNGLQWVVDYAADRGFRITTIPARRCAILRGPRAALTAAFQPLPLELAAPVEAVFGLEANQPVLHAGIAQVPGTGHKPAALAKALKLPAGDGAGHCIGVLSFAGTVSAAALSAACGALGLAAPKTAPHVVSVDAGSTMAHDGKDPNDPLLPMLTVLAALVPKAKIVVYAAPPTLRGWVDALSAALHDPDNRPIAVCSGWVPPAGCEMATTLARQATALRIHLHQASTDPSGTHKGSHAVESGTKGQSWSGSAIDAAIAAASDVLALPKPPPAPPSPPDPPRPTFEATTYGPGLLIAAQRDRIAYETDPYPGPRAKGTLVLPWMLLPGSNAADIAVGGDGSLWALSAVPTLSGTALFQMTAAGWRPAGAGGVAVAADVQGHPWVVDAFGTLLRFTGTDWHVEHAGVCDVAVSPQGAVWALSKEVVQTGHTVLHRPPRAAGHAAPAWIDDKTVHAQRIAVAPDGTAWIVSNMAMAMRYDPHGKKWITEASNVRDVFVDAEGGVWVVSQRGRRIYRRATPDDGWQRADGVAERLVVQPGGMVWAVTPTGGVAVARPDGELV